MKRVLLVAEIGINHNGDLEIAKKLINLAGFAGCDFVKFQKRTIDLVYSEEELNKPRESPWGTTNREQKEGLEFGRKEYDEIDAYCRQIGIPWFASPWDVESVKFLESYDLPYMKVASALVTDHELLGEMKRVDSPVILSTGMSTRAEIEDAIFTLGGLYSNLNPAGVEYLLACTSTYPTADEEMNLNFITSLKEQYGCKVGFSNHSPGIVYMIAAAALGVKMIEFHITLDRASYGSDQAASIESPGVIALAKHVRHIEVAMGHGEWVVYPSEEEIKKKLRKQ